MRNQRALLALLLIASTGCAPDRSDIISFELRDPAQRIDTYLIDVLPEAIVILSPSSERDTVHWKRISEVTLPRYGRSACMAASATGFGCLGLCAAVKALDGRSDPVDYILVGAIAAAGGVGLGSGLVYVTLWERHLIITSPADLEELRDYIRH